MVSSRFVNLDPSVEFGLVWFIDNVGQLVSVAFVISYGDVTFCIDDSPSILNGHDSPRFLFG